MARLNPLSLYSCSHFVSHFIYSICSLFPTHAHNVYSLSSPLACLSLSLCLHRCAICPLYYYYAVSFLTILFYSLATYQYSSSNSSSSLVSGGIQLNFILRTHILTHTHTYNIDGSEVGLSFKNLLLFTVSLPIWFRFRCFRWCGRRQYGWYVWCMCVWYCVGCRHHHVRSMAKH